MTNRAKMTVEEHVQTARDFLEESDHEFSNGDDLQGSEKLWGAAAHALTAVIQRQGMEDISHRALRFQAEALAREYDDYRIRAGFIAADMFHRNFYNYFMDEHDIEDNRPIVREFVERILTLQRLREG